MTQKEMQQGPAFDPMSLPARRGSSYPGPFAEICAGREKRAIGDAAGLKNYGVNIVTLAPGAASAQRHWHTRQDELVYVLDGELTLVTDAGEQVMTPGMAAGFPASKPDGHHLVNRSDRPAIYLEVGDRTDGDETDYPDIDMVLRWRDGKRVFLHRNGEPW